MEGGYLDSEARSHGIIQADGRLPLIVAVMEFDLETHALFIVLSCDMLEV